jgi:cytochrome P450
MPMVSELDLLEVDPLDPALRGEHFHDALPDLAAQGWLARTPLGTIVLDHQAGMEFLRDRRLSFPSVELLELQGITDGPVHERVKNGLLALVGENHARLRRLVSPAFTPRAIDRLRPSLHAFLDQLWNAVAPEGRCDFVDAFARRLPSMAIAQLLGLPGEADRMAAYSEALQAIFKADLAHARADLEAAYLEVYAYIEDVVEQRRRALGDDLISALVAVEQEGDRLSTDECVSLVTSVIAGGTDTTQAQLSHGMRLFVEHPDQWERLGNRPELGAQAANEVLRFEPITPFTARRARDHVPVRGVEFPEGTVVFVCAATANRDPSVFTDPERFDVTIDRSGASILTFGNGPHFCLGANLARAELTETFGFLAPRMRHPEFTSPPVYGSPIGIYAMESVPIKFTSTTP